jgi:predicted ribosome quality control (RQC) complex YloA/Tae2 family protein
MSLNWKEIDLVLSELDLAGAKIERVLQPSFDSLCLSLYKEGQATELFISIAQGACRINALASSPPKAERPLRFQECLRSRIVGGRIEAVAQLGDERILRFDIGAPRSEGVSARDKVYKPIGPGARKVHSRSEGSAGEIVNYKLYVRLWSGAGNVILVDEEGAIVDVIARRPKRGELSGEVCRIEESLARDDAQGIKPRREFEARDLPPLPGREGGGSFNERVEAFYSQGVGELSRERLLESAREKFGKKERILEARIAELGARAAEFKDGERLRELGDILMACQGLAFEGQFVEADDFYRGGRVRIPVDPKLGAVENARAFYERHRKAKSGLADVESELSSAKASLERLKRELSTLEAEEDPFLIARALAKGGTAKKEEARGSGKSSRPGLSLEVSDWTILVGRNASENDELLRHHIKGSDLWLHARDWAGSYVFVKARKGKSFPLEILVDAGMLALYYSKGRANGSGDLYYTQAKYLRRAKDGPKGLVIPTQEKNLSVKIDEARIKELRSLIGEDAEK